MNKLYKLKLKTNAAAQDAFANRLISKRVFHRLTDGTVSRYDVAEAKKLVQERRATYEARKQDYPNNPRKWESLQRAYYDAQLLHRRITDQYAEQGYVETGLENASDDWNGASW